MCDVSISSCRLETAIIDSTWDYYRALIKRIKKIRDKLDRATQVENNRLGIDSVVWWCVLLKRVAMS
jgi:hypothetical protein